MSNSSRTGFSDNVKAFAACPTDSKISSFFCSCLNMMFLTELQLIFVLISIVTSLLVVFAPDIDSLSDPETSISPDSKVSSNTGSSLSRFLVEVYVPLDYLGLIKGSTHERKFSSSIFRSAFFKDIVPVPDTFFSLSSPFTREYLFLSFSHFFPPNQLKQKKKKSMNKKDCAQKEFQKRV